MIDSMSVTKIDIVERIYREAGLTKKDASEFVDLVFEAMKHTLAKGEAIKIPGLGTFSVNDKSRRMGRNPQTGEALEIAERRVLTFKSSNNLKEDITARYAHRMDDNGNEDKTIPVNPSGVLRTLSNADEE